MTNSNFKTLAEISPNQRPQWHTVISFEKYAMHYGFTRKQTNKLVKLLQEYIYLSLEDGGKFVYTNVCTFEIKDTFTNIPEYRDMIFKKVKIKPSPLLLKISKKKWFRCKS